MGQIPEVDAEGSKEGRMNRRQKKKLFNRKCGYRLDLLSCCPVMLTEIFIFYKNSFAVAKTIIVVDAGFTCVLHYFLLSVIIRLKFSTFLVVFIKYFALSGIFSVQMRLYVTAPIPV